MSPALPYEVSSAPPRRSTRATLRPRFCRCSATQIPMIPAPRTIASTRALDWLNPSPLSVSGEPLHDARHFGVVEDRGLPHLERLPVHARERLDLLGEADRLRERCAERHHAVVGEQAR